MKKIGILTIGDELLIGKVSDTNKTFISSFLQKFGLTPTFQLTVDDRVDSIQWALRALKEMDIVITTGGLGSTADDVTRSAVEACGGYELLRYIPNDVGAEKGEVYQSQNQILILLPGPPRENRPMLYELTTTLGEEPHYSQTMKVYGHKEIDLERKILSVLENDKHHLFATYVGFGITDVVFHSQISEEVEEMVSLVKKELGHYVISDDDRTIQEVILHEAKAKNLQIRLVESMTGGMLSSALVDASGASEVLHSSLVLYQKDAKDEILQLKEETEKWGTVGKEITKILAQKVYTEPNILSVAITGYADEGKGYLCIIEGNSIVEKEYEFPHTRNLNRLRMSNSAMIEMLKVIRRKDV